MKKEKHLFLDLEDTIITPVLSGWWNTQIINERVIEKVLADWNPDFIHIFSFAIHNKRELDLFEIGTRPIIESFLKRKLDKVFSVEDDILPVCCKAKGLSIERTDFSDLCDFWGKQDSFRIFLRNCNLFGIFHPVEVLFLDDCVEDEDFSFHTPNIGGLIRKIDFNCNISVDFLQK